MDKLDKGTINQISAQLVGETIERYGNSLTETIAGMDRLEDVAKQYINVVSDITQGRMFEIIESTKFNANAAKAGELLRAVTTETLGDPHASADILIGNEMGSILQEVQAKSYTSEGKAAWTISDEKYESMQLLVNSDKFKKVKKLTDIRKNTKSINAKRYKSSSKRLSGHLHHENISSGGTTYSEALEAATDPEKYRRILEQKEFITGMQNSLVNGALSGAFVGGTISAVDGFYSESFSVKETGKEMTNSAIRTSITSGISYGIKFLGRENPVMNGNIAVNLASSAVNLTELTYQFLNKEIDMEEYLFEIGSNSVSCYSSIVLAAAGGALFGPVGAVTAGTIGIIGMKQLYKTFEEAHLDLKLAKEARDQAEIISIQIKLEIETEEDRLVSFYQEYEQTLKDLKGIVDHALTDESYTEQAIVSLANDLNISFKYGNLTDFQDFMASEEILEL